MVWEQLKEELIFPKLEASNSKEVFEKVGGKFIEEGFCKDSYVDALVNRESEFPTGIDVDGFGIAIPHTDISHVNKAGIAIATLENPVKFVQMGTDDEEVEAKLAQIPQVDYDRIGERMHVELVYVNCDENADAAKFTALVEKAKGLGRTLILGCTDPEIAKAALEVCKDGKPVLNGANASNYEAMNKVATDAGVVLGVSGKDINELYDTTAAIEKLGNKNLVLDTTGADVKETFANTVQVRRAALKNQDRTFGYPSIVNVVKLAKGDYHLQAALASLFTMKYGSIIVMEQMTYAEALPLFGLRQNVFTDPQKPMKVEPGIYPLNGADENSLVVTTVDFALTYFVVSGELERSGVPLNLVINDAGGLSVLTSWAAGKFSGNSISEYIKENVEPKVKCRRLVIPGKVAVLKGDLEAKLPGWEIIVGPREAVQLVKFLKDLDA